jgi:hypothetical protein
MMGRVGKFVSKMFASMRLTDCCGDNMADCYIKYQEKALLCGRTPSTKTVYTIEND